MTSCTCTWKRTWTEGPSATVGNSIPPSLNWDDRPPSDRPRLGTQVFAHNAKGPPAFLRLLGNARGLWLHWDNGRTVPCLRPRCERCDSGDPPRWKAYAPAQLWKRDLSKPDAPGSWINVVADLTAQAVDDLGEDAANLRGCVIELKRQGTRNNSPLRARLIERVREEKTAM